MQSSMIYFCEQCGAANPEDASYCVACQHSIHSPSETGQSSVAPIPITPVATSSPAAGTLSASTSLSNAPLKPGMLLDNRYRLITEIGKGGFGCVFKARDLKQHNRLVAIKQIDLSALSPREIIEATDSFNREITFLSTLSHPNLPKIHAHFTDSTHWYMVMQYIRGRTLEDYLKRSRRGYLSTWRVVKIGQAVSDVLSYLHSRKPPIIFRDVKPANIMLTRTGHVYLIDFGIARRFSPGKKRDTGPLGSPGYAAPEQYGLSQTDARTDIYALGATLQTLFTGLEPLEARQGLPPRRPRLLPDDLQSLLNSMQEADPAKRPKNLTNIEERFSWMAEHMFDPFAFLKGLAIGLIFLLCYWPLSIGGDMLKSHYNPHVSPPLWVILYLICVNLFPFAVFGTLIYQVISLSSPEKRMRAIGVLIILLLMFLLIAFGLLPPLFQWFPHGGASYP